MTYTQQQIAAMCREYGPELGPLPAGVDGVQLLWALAGVESSFGYDTTPRHEPAYDRGGRYATHAPMPLLLAKYGSAAACSYGPWQVMLCNFPAGTTIAAASDLETAAKATVIFLNILLRHWHPTDLDDIGECWNAGHITPDPAYTSKLDKAYATPLAE
jgi:hypothetical protein